MKIQILDINGSKLKEATSKLFDGSIRLDLIQKVAEAEKMNDMLKQEYAPYLWAGMQTSAGGNVKHNRHVWKTDRGRGLSRYPKKRMSDKGSQFVWVAAAIPGVRKGRKAHAPKLGGRELKINKKEMIIAVSSALAMCSSLDELKKKYSTLGNVQLKIKLPLVVESKILSLKAKEFFASLEKILGSELMPIALQERSVRSGRGKMRNRTYKKNSGILIVTANNQDKKISGVDVIKAKELRISDIASNGARLIMFTEEAIKDLENKIYGVKE